MKLPNKENVSEIVMRPTVHCLCTLGGDWYSIDFEVRFVPAEYYPDYMDVAAFLAENIDGKSLNIEEALELVGVYLKTVYVPESLTVTADIKNAKTHFPVTVKKTY